MARIFVAIVIAITLVSSGCGGSDGPSKALPGDLCNPNPCKSGGACAQVGDAFSCTCDGNTGWSGNTCETCGAGWSQACDSCKTGYERQGRACVNSSPCSPHQLGGRCPAGAACDDKLGHCALLDPTLPCTRYVDWTEGVAETPLCAKLHDEVFLEEQTGDYLGDGWLAHFEAVWNNVDQGYGAFAATPVNWDDVHGRYRKAAERAASAYSRTQVLFSMLAELGDSHTGYLNLALCENNLALSSQGSPWRFSAVEVAKELYVYHSEDDRVKVGDRIASVNGLSGDALRGYWRERLRCDHGFSSKSIEQESYESSVLALAADPLLVNTDVAPLLHLVIDRQDGGTLVLRPGDASKDLTANHISYRSYYLEGAPITLAWEPYDTGQWGGGRTSQIGHGKHGSIAVLLFYDFTGENDLARAMRAVVPLYPDATGWIIDVRLNSGGGPHQNTLASFFIQQPVSQPDTLCKNGTAHDALGDCGVAAPPVKPDPEIQINKPVAVLIGGSTVSAADHFAYLMKQVPTARLFGQPTAGAFGNVSIQSTETDPFSLVVTWTRVFDEDGMMQGRSVEPHELIQPTVADVRGGSDPVMGAAVKWVNSQVSQP